MGQIKSSWTPPKPMKDGTLLMQGLLCVLTRRLTATQSETTIKNLQSGFFYLAVDDEKAKFEK